MPTAADLTRLPALHRVLMMWGSARCTLGQAGPPLCSSQSKLGLAGGPPPAALSVLLPLPLLSAYRFPGWD